jgi:hypothetical protein
MQEPESDPSESKDEVCKELYILSQEYHIEFDRLPKILRNPKVLPMIRGISFEHSAQKRLSDLLPSNEYSVSQPISNPQPGDHEPDLEIEKIGTKEKKKVECKLAKNDSYSEKHPTISEMKKSKAWQKVKNKSKLKNKEEIKEALKGEGYEYEIVRSIKVKCHRSRTSESKSGNEAKAKEYGISTTQAKAHSDYYHETDFDIVLASAGNAFYSSAGNEDKLPSFQPSSEAKKLLEESGLDSISLNGVIYAAPTSDLAPSKKKPCTSKDCEKKTKCEFIPKIPVIELEVVDGKLMPKTPWVKIGEIEKLL